MDVDCSRQGDLLTTLFGSRDVYFDGSEANASLYLCFPAGAPEHVVASIVEHMRHTDLWGPELKQVAPEQRCAYAAQLTFQECLSVTLSGTVLLALRGTHPKFPSHGPRWERWRATLLAAESSAAAHLAYDTAAS